MTDQTLVRIVLASRPEGTPVPENFRVGLGRAHSPAHVGIQGKIADFEQYLTVRRGRDAAR